MTTQHGFTLIELLIVVAIIGLLVLMATPRIGIVLVGQSVHSARDASIGMHGRARAAAVQRGQSTRLVISGNTLLIRSEHPVTGAVDTVGPVRDLFDQYRVTVTSSRDSLVFDPRGLGNDGGPTVITVTRGVHADTIVISTWGRILK